MKKNTVITKAMLLQVIEHTEYKDWTFLVHEKGDGFLLQAVFMGSDVTTGKAELQKCRKWYVSSHACIAEIVRTLYMAVEAAEIHEFQERFKFMGQALFSPHLKPHDISLLIKSGAIGNSVREEK
jgi:hypothetical protein